MCIVVSVSSYVMSVPSFIKFAPHILILGKNTRICTGNDLENEPLFWQIKTPKQCPFNFLQINNDCHDFDRIYDENGSKLLFGLVYNPFLAIGQKYVLYMFLYKHKQHFKSTVVCKILASLPKPSNLIWWNDHQTCILANMYKKLFWKQLSYFGPKTLKYSVLTF